MIQFAIWLYDLMDFTNAESISWRLNEESEVSLADVLYGLRTARLAHTLYP
jgi:hypothetical protein